MSGLLTFTFRVRGHGQDLDSGLRIKAETLEEAVKKAKPYISRFEIPGWELYCEETKTAVPIMPAVKKTRRA